MTYRTKIAHLTDVHPATDVRIYHKECGTLVQAGYQVVLIAPSAKQIPTEVQFLPIQKPEGRLERMWLGPLRVLRQALAADAEVYHLHDPELIPIGLILKALRKYVIYDAHEDLEEQVGHKAYMGPFKKAIAGVLARILCWLVSVSFDAVITATPRIATTFPARKTWVVRNYPRLEELSPSDQSEPLGNRPKWAVYVGSITERRGLFEMLEAAAELGPRFDFRLILGGVFDSEALASRARAHPGWPYIDFRGWLDRDAVVKALSEARCGLLPLHPTPAYLESLPVKLFEYMASGLPVVASRFKLWEELLGDRVLFVEPRCGKRLAKGIEKALAEDGSAEVFSAMGKQAVESSFNWATEKVALLDAYDAVLNTKMEVR